MNRMIRETTLSILLALSFSIVANAQGYLHAEGTSIIDGSGNNFISRSIGTGNWMIMEGYMMKTSEAGIHTHTEFRDKLESEIGEEKTEIFYDNWLANHFTKADVDSMKAWGFNSIRPALHYKWFTLPIEDEPVAGENTWTPKGFEMLDSLMAWCTANEMYVFLDMHGAPGGQGKNADISDYDSNLPSLWESEDNKQKLVALWHKIAERYNTEPYLAGYDMINEINWDFANSGNENGCNCTQNQPMIDIFTRIIDTIRTVDQNHMVFVSGNCWGNKYDGLDALAALDDNLAYTFHKYWTFNYENDLDWITERRDRLNVPLWMSESGENSNTWFTNATHLFESNNIGWSWWPVKKAGINNVMEVEVNEEYQNLLDYWEKGSPAMNEDEIYDAVMGWAENHKLENTFIHYDVVDALTRQISSKESKPFKKHSTTQEIFFADYDLGRNMVAYTDKDTANHHGSTGEYTNWNAGWAYRNDGVDIEACQDGTSNGFNVGWTDQGEWMQYTMNVPEEAAYKLDLRSAGEGGTVHFELNGSPITTGIDLPSTGGWQTWETTTVEDIILPQGTVKIRFHIDEGGSNLNYFKLYDPTPSADVAFKLLAASTSEDGYEIYASLNKEVTTANADILLADFTLSVDYSAVDMDAIAKQVSPTNVLIIKHNESLYSGNEVTLSYDGSSVKAGSQDLDHFTDAIVVNKLPKSHVIPTKIQAEDFSVNNGMVKESCEDTGGGYNMGYANAGDHLDYTIYVPEEAKYSIDYRFATTNGSSTAILKVGDGETFTDLETISISSTGGWQTWATQTSTIELPQGAHVLRFYVKGGEFNFNWMDIKLYTSIESGHAILGFDIYPNPAKSNCTLNLGDTQSKKTIDVIDHSGRVIYTETTNATILNLELSTFSAGIYFIKLTEGNQSTLKKLIVE